MNQSRSRGKVVRGTVSVLVCVGLFALGFAAVYFRQNIIDQATVFFSSPSDEVVAIADRISFGDHGKFLYYASIPHVASAEEFNDICQNHKEATAAVIGCYSQNRIYIYDIEDSRLDGIKEVTAAHEMLHAAYQRLGSKDKQRLNTLLERVYRNNINDPAFAARMKYYDTYQPGYRYNELHSIVGTEFADISEELEVYYARYFDDRTRVVALHAQYVAVFDSLNTQIATLKQQIAEENSFIDEQSRRYNVETTKLTGNISSFNYRAENGHFASNAAFQQERRTLVNRVRELEQLYQQIQESITRYDAYVTEYNNATITIKELTEKIDSRIQPPPSL